MGLFDLLIAGALLLVAAVVFVVPYALALGGRIVRLQRQVDELARDFRRATGHRQPAMGVTAAAPVVEPPPKEEWRERPAEPVPPLPPRPAATSKPAPVPPVPRPLPAAAPEAEEAPAAPPARPAKPRRSSREWEATVGGSLLNKAGALILVIGIALFLGYSFTQMNAGGRALTALGASLTLLAGGLALERKEMYRVFARGLIGAGWAALYVTVAALYAVPASRVIHNPYLGSLLLLAVAAAMIAHSLRYRVQAVTAVAYFAAFAALSVIPWSSFALFSLIPLSVSLLLLAHRFRWHAMAVFGVAAAYATCLWRGLPDISFVAAQSLLLIYWIVFELFDLFRVRRRTVGAGIELVFPINALGFLGLSYKAWSAADPLHVWRGCAWAAGLYAASAVARGLLRRRNSFAPSDELLTRLRAGSLEAPVALAAVLAGSALAGRLLGVALTTGLAIEAELLFLTGVFLDLPALRWLAGAGFSLSIYRLVAGDLAAEGIVTLASGKTVHQWTPPALFHAALFYFNRFLRKQGGALYSSAACALVTGVLAQELPDRSVGCAWLALALVLFEAGIRTRARDLRRQTWAAALGGVVAACLRFGLPAGSSAWPWLGAALALLYALVLRVRFAPAVAAVEGKWFNLLAGAGVTALTLQVVHAAAPPDYRGALFCAAALLLWELGMRNLPASLLRYAPVAAGLGALLTITESAPQLGKFPLLHVWASYAIAGACLYALGERAKSRFPAVRFAATSLALYFALGTVWLLIPDLWVAPVWALVALVLHFDALRRGNEPERWQSFAVMLAAVCQAGTLRFRATTILVLAACYFAQFATPKPKLNAAPVERYARLFWSVLGTLCLTAFLWQKFPGGLLTIAWAGAGLALLAAGFPLRERVLRLQGLGLLVVCILKLFVYDLRNLETVYRILSFVALGIILLGVSSIYTRFRDRVKPYL